VSAARYTKEEREAKRSERLALLDRAVEQLTSSDAWAAWLGVRRRFHAYSWRNQLMIAWQRPDTLAVRGLRQWSELGRRVRKGSAAIWILAPAPYKTEERDAEGNQLKKMYFKPVAVFAYEDTDQIEDGPVFQIEPPFADVEGDSHEPQLRQLVTWLNGQGLTVLEDEVTDAAHGWFLPPSTIGLAARLSPNAKLKTLVHESCHWLVRQEPRKQGWDYAEEEVVVESAAYAVCATLGLETAAYSAGYVANWREQGPEPADLVAAVDALATRIEAVLGCA
jgi:hypothetical protein